MKKDSYIRYLFLSSKTHKMNVGITPEESKRVDELMIQKSKLEQKLEAVRKELLRLIYKIEKK